MSDTVFEAFGFDHAMRVTGLTRSQLSYWDKTGFFHPAYGSDGADGTPARLYSFRDLVGLKVLHVLRTVHGLSLVRLRMAAEKLQSYAEAPWAELKIYVSKREIAFVEPGTGRARTIKGQYVMVEIIDVINDVKLSVKYLNHRGPEQVGQTVRNRAVMHNAEVFAGTRVPVRAVRAFLLHGYSIDQIMLEYPSLDRGDIESVAKTIPAAA